MFYFILVQITPPPVPYSNSFLSVSDAPTPAAFGQLKEEARKDIFEGSLSLSRLKGSTRLTPRELQILHSPPNLFTSLTKSFALFVLLIILARAPLTLFASIAPLPVVELLRSSTELVLLKKFELLRSSPFSLLTTYLSFQSFHYVPLPVGTSPFSLSLLSHFFNKTRRGLKTHALALVSRW